MSNARADQLVREAYVQDSRNVRVTQMVREAYVKLSGIPNAAADQLVREAYVTDAPHARADQIVREVFCQESPHARVNQLLREAYVALTGNYVSMPITYPLSIPGALGESKATLTKYDAIGEQISEFTGSAEQQQWQDQHWELDLEWPEMTWAQFAAYDAFIGALHGKLGSFLWGPPLSTAPRGSALGSPALASDSTIYSGSTTIDTTGWTASQSGLLLPGDFFALQGGSDTILRVTVTGGVLYVDIGYPSPIGANAVGLVCGFAGLTGATWLNGAKLVCSGAYVHLPYHGLYFNTLPSGAPTSYGPTSDTGTLTAGSTRLYQYVDSSALTSDSSGNATLDIFPGLREAFSGTSLVLSNPQGTFRLADNRRAPQADQKKTFALKLKCREAI